MNSILILHLAGAVATLAVIAGGFYSLLRSRGRRFWQTVLYFVAFYQVLTGAWLLLITPGSSLVGSCLRGVAYLTLVGLVQVRWAKQVT